MKKFNISLTMRGESFVPAYHDSIEGDDLLEVISKFILTIAKLSRHLLDEEYKKRLDSDDIPF